MHAAATKQAVHNQSSPVPYRSVFSSVRIQAIQHYGYIPEFFAALHLSSIAAKIQKYFFNAVPDLLLLPDCSDEGIREESSNESCDISVLWG